MEKIKKSSLRKLELRAQLELLDDMKKNASHWDSEWLDNKVLTLSNRLDELENLEK